MIDQGNVKVTAKVLIFRVCGDLKIRNTKLETRTFVFVSDFELRASNLLKIE